VNNGGMRSLLLTLPLLLVLPACAGGDGEPTLEERREAYAEEVKAAAAAGDGATLLRLVQERPQTSADLDFMREYGFDQCVRAADQQG